MSLTADDGIRVFVDGEDVSDKVEITSVSGVSGAFDVQLPTDITVANGDIVSFTWSETIDDDAEVIAAPLAALSGRMRVVRDGPSISAEDWKIIDGAIIESVARGHARRL